MIDLEEPKKQYSLLSFSKKIYALSLILSLIKKKVFFIRGKRVSDCLLILDELGQVQAKDVGNIVYMLGNSKGKSRMNADSELKKNIDCFSCFFLNY
jgi:hypothetical protein